MLLNHVCNNSPHAERPTKLTNTKCPKTCFLGLISCKTKPNLTHKYKMPKTFVSWPHQLQDQATCELVTPCLCMHACIILWALSCVRRIEQPSHAQKPSSDSTRPLSIFISHPRLPSEYPSLWTTTTTTTTTLYKNQSRRTAATFGLNEFVLDERRKQTVFARPQSVLQKEHLYPIRSSILMVIGVSRAGGPWLVGSNLGCSHGAFWVPNFCERSPTRPARNIPRSVAS